MVKFNEAAVFHKPTRTLLVTDCVVHVSDTPSEVCAEKELLESGDDNNFVINSLKLLNLFNIRDKAKSRTTSSADMTREEVRAERGIRTVTTKCRGGEVGCRRKRTREIHRSLFRYITQLVSAQGSVVGLCGYCNDVGT